MGTISALNSVPSSTTVPTIALANPTYNGIGTGYIFGNHQDYVGAPSGSKTINYQTSPAGAHPRHLATLYFQHNSRGGSFHFDPSMPASPGSGATGSSGN